MLGRLYHYVRKLGLEQSVQQLESFYFYIEYGLEEMYQEQLQREEDSFAINDPEHLFGQVG